MSKTEKVPGTVSVRAHFRRGGEVIKEGTGEQVIEILSFEQPHGFASVALGKKIYQGSFNTAEVRVMVSFPCYAEEVQEALQTAERIAAENAARIAGRFKKESSG